MKIALTENGYIVRFVKIMKDGKIGVIVNSKIFDNNQMSYFIKIFDSSYCAWFKESEIEIYIPSMQDILNAYLYSRGKEIIERGNNVLVNSKCIVHKFDNIRLSQHDITNMVEDIHTKSLSLLDEAIGSVVQKVEKLIIAKYMEKIIEVAHNEMENNLKSLFESYDYKRDQ